MSSDSSLSAHLVRALALGALLLWTSSGQAQQNPAERLWQGIEQQQARRANTPAPLDLDQGTGPHDATIAALMQSPAERLQLSLLTVLDAVNKRDWFRADRALRQYARLPDHDPALVDYVAAGRAAARGDYDAAVSGYAQVMRANPAFMRGELDLARTLYADQRLLDAQEAFERLLRQPLPPLVVDHVEQYLQAIAQRERAQWSLSVSGVHEDNVNSASTVFDPCALDFLGACLPNIPGKKQAATGVYVEASLNKLWSLSGHHGVLLRSINYGNRYWHHHDYDSFVSTTYLGYQYASAETQVQLLPLFEYDNEGGREIYHAIGARASVSRPLGERAQIEASIEYKARRFAPRLEENLHGHLRSASVFGQYALPKGWIAFGHLLWRESDARLPIFAFHEGVARLGTYKSFDGQVSVNVAAGWRRKRADGINSFFGRRQRDIERSLYLNLTVPRYAWQRLTPTLTYEYRDNASNVAHAYNYEKHRLALGVNAVF